MTERLLNVDQYAGDRHRHLGVGDWHEIDIPSDAAADTIAAELDRLYAAAEANQAPGPDWKAKLREDVAGEVSTAAAHGWNEALTWVLGRIDALPDPPTPDPDAPPVYEPPEGHYAPVEGRNVPDGWEGRRWAGGHWWSAETCRGNPTALFEVRRVPAPEPATEWVPLTKLVGRTIKGETEPVHRTDSPNPSTEWHVERSRLQRRQVAAADHAELVRHPDHHTRGGAVMDAPDEMVEAVAQAVRSAESEWRSALWPRDPGERGAPNRLGFIARAVLSVPALAEVIARDAKVRELAEDIVWLAKLAQGSSWPGEMADRVQRAADRVVSELGSDADRAAIAALYPEAGK